MSNYRDHAANERSFLGWVQTGIGFLILGFLVERFDRVVRGMASSQTQELGATPLVDAGTAGVILMLIGGGLILCAGARYYGVRRMLRAAEQGESAKLPSPTLMAAMILAPLFAALIYLVYRISEFTLVVNYGG